MSMSKVVGALLHTALTVAGHDEFHTVHTEYDMNSDEILVRFDRGVNEELECVSFRVPARVFDFDPVAYAKKTWPKWFVKQEKPT